MGVVVRTGAADGLQLDEYALYLGKEVVRDNCPVCSFHDSPPSGVFGR